MLTRGGDGEWDSETVMEAAVIHDGTEFRMWYAGNDGEVAGVGYATSPDGTTWTKHTGNPIMGVGPAGSFDGGSIWPSTVLFNGQMYRMWYTGVRDLGGFTWTIGYAESDDGLSWTRRPEPVVETGGGWESDFVYAPLVLLDGPVHRMWYAGFGGSSIHIGYAESRDGVTWTKYFGNPVLVRDYRTCNPKVLYDEASGAYWMWYRNHDDDSFRLATSDCCKTTHAMFIPAAALASGAQGSFYQTDVDLNNPGDQPVEYQFMWYPRGQDNSEPTTSETFTLGAGMSVRYGNVLSEVFGLEPNSLGALMVLSSSPDLLAMSRTYNSPEGEDAGTFGQAIPAVAPSEFIQSGERRRILFASENDDLRFNVGCQNGGDGSLVVNLELFDHEGISLGTEMMILRAWGNDQLNRVLQDYMPVNGYVDVWTTQAGKSFYCYGSVLDNVTSDPTTVLPQ